MQPNILKFWVLLLIAPMPAFAQDKRPSVIAVPQFATPENVSTPAGDTGSIARGVADVIASDLRSTRELVPIGPETARVYSYPEATAPSFSQWRKTGAKSLVTGFVQKRSDGRLTIACYLHDISGAREIARKGFVVTPDEWRPAAHRCSDAVYARLVGRPGSFDSQIAYVAETGANAAKIKRIAIMDGDGSSNRFLTAGDATVLTPRLSPSGDRLAYVSFSGGRPHVRLVTLDSNKDRQLVAGDSMTFAPDFSFDGKNILFSMAAGGNTDIFVTTSDGAAPRRLTATPGVDTAPSFSPDGSRIVFESDRSGSEQLYIMNADGSAVQRISFGGARYASPAWSPDGGLIAFTRIAGDGLSIGVMTPTGSGERILTAGVQGEGPSWAASSRDLLFQGSDAGGRTGLYKISVDGGASNRIQMPQDASDPDWSTAGEK